MIRSLYSGVSGLTTHQTRMDVIGNNIANVNSYGYKAHRTTFRDIYYQATKSASSGKTAYAGNNVSEVGYGVRLGSIDKDMSASSGQSTGRNWDMMIEADGFFMSATFDGNNVTSDLGTRGLNGLLYTRFGNFGPDSYGNLATADNRFVIGSNNSLAGLKTTGAESETALDGVQLKDRNGDGKINQSDIQFRNTINLNQLIQTAYNVHTDDFGYMYGINWETITGEIDLAAGTADPLAAGNFLVYDYDGAAGAFPTDAAERMQYVDVKQSLINLKESGTAAFQAIVTAHPTWFCAVDKTGKQVADGATYNTNLTAMVNAADAEALKTAKSAANTAGMQQGELTYSNVGTIQITERGQLICTYNDELRYLARIELACFDNPEGLKEAGGTNFMVSAASGDARISGPGTDGAGPVKNTYLEMSNVNLANEFSDMIITQRGYQANARMITTSDSMLEELVNLKR